MTLILNSPETFAAESLAGFVAANATRVRPAPGGVVRSTVRATGQGRRRRRWWLRPLPGVRRRRG